MTEPEDAESVGSDNFERSLTEQQRAIGTIKAINAGGDPSAEAFRLANGFTDRQTARLFAWFGRWKSRN
jgi:hypothetical protein